MTDSIIWSRNFSYERRSIHDVIWFSVCMCVCAYKFISYLFLLWLTRIKIIILYVLLWLFESIANKIYWSCSIELTSLLEHSNWLFSLYFEQHAANLHKHSNVLNRKNSLHVFHIFFVWISLWFFNTFFFLLLQFYWKCIHTDWIN